MLLKAIYWSILRFKIKVNYYIVQAIHMRYHPKDDDIGLV